jgi:hypothetical protein
MNKLITDNQKACLRRAGYTETELKDLTVKQASSVLHYVSRNNWKRPTPAQVETIAAEEMKAEEQASKNAVPLARIPSRRELNRLTKDMSATSAYAFEEGMESLEYAVDQGTEDPRLQGWALCMLRIACSLRQWDKVLETIGVPSVVARRQMQLAKDADAKLSKQLKKRGVRLEFTMSAEELRLVYREAEAVMAKNAKNEALTGTPQLLHRGADHPEDDNPPRTLSQAAPRITDSRCGGGEESLPC